MRNAFLIFLATFIVCALGIAPYSAGFGRIQESQEQTLADPTPTLQASSEEERMTWNKVAREDELEKKSQRAEDYLEKFSDGVYAPYAHEIVAVEALGRNDTKTFKEHAEKAVASMPESVMLQVELAVIYAEEQNPEPAIAHGEKVLPILTTLIASAESDGSDLEKRRISMMADTNYALGTAYLFQGFNSRKRLTINRAIAYLETAVQLNNQDERSHFRLAFGYQVTRKVDRALEEYARAVALERSNSAMARQYLEQAYTKKYGSLDGIEEFIASQKSQMNAPSLTSDLLAPIPEIKP